MKLLLIKCPICTAWHSPKRAHCPVCNASHDGARIVNEKGNELVRAFVSDLAFQFIIK